MSVVAERIRTYTPLGIRFWDPARESQVRDGLRVTIQPDVVPPRTPVPAFRTGSGYYAFQGVPGLRMTETGPESNAVEADPLPFVVTVVDTTGRYLPTVFAVDLPVTYTGLFRPTGDLGSPPDDDAGTRFYLFSAPTRSVAPGLAVLRAQLHDRANNSPAGYALIEVSDGADTWYGLSAGNGAAAVIFPYPTFTRSLGEESPPGLADEQVWSLTVRVYYEPAVLNQRPEHPVPDLGTIRLQGSASLFAEEAGTATDSLTIPLLFEKEALLATADLSHLLIEPSISSP